MAKKGNWQYCLRDRHSTVINKATWAWHYLWQPFSVRIVWYYIQKCNLNLYYTKRKPYVNYGHKMLSCSFGTSLSLMNRKKMFCCQKCLSFSCLLGKLIWTGSACHRWVRLSRPFSVKGEKSQHLWWNGSTSVSTASLMKKLTLESWRDIIC